MVAAKDLNLFGHDGEGHHLGEFVFVLLALLCRPFYAGEESIHLSVVWRHAHSLLFQDELLHTRLELLAKGVELGCDLGL